MSPDYEREPRCRPITDVSKFVAWLATLAEGSPDYRREHSYGLTTGVDIDIATLSTWG